MKRTVDDLLDEVDAMSTPLLVFTNPTDATSDWQELAPLGGVRRRMSPGGVVQYETQPGETARDARNRGTIVMLVALCEELLAEHASTLSIVQEIFGPMGPMLDEIAAKLPDYRARLAQLKGER